MCRKCRGKRCEAHALGASRRAGDPGLNIGAVTQALNNGGSHEPEAEPHGIGRLV
jgi:hypothetical protein